jgi:hypothetical protein
LARFSHGLIANTHAKAKKIEKIKSLGSNMESTSWRQYDSLIGYQTYAYLNKD